MNAQELQAGYRLGEYEIIKVLGSGGFGVTYLAKEESLNRLVVIKENLPAMFAVRESSTLSVTARCERDKGDFEWAMNNFLNEARTLAALDHAHIVKIFRAFVANGTAYFVMPYVEGEDMGVLVEKMKERGEYFSSHDIRLLLNSLLNALEYLHGKNILHRDIKPNNILMLPGNVPIFIDFGTARQQIGEKSMTVIESAGYTPFEQMQSRGNVGPWSDLYALGATFYKVITGESPPQNADRMGKTDAYKSLSQQECLRKKYDLKLLQTIDKALSLWPEDRYQSAKEWRDDLLESTAPSYPLKEEETKKINEASPTLLVKSNQEQPSLTHQDFSTIPSPVKKKSSSMKLIIAILLSTIVIGMTLYVYKPWRSPQAWEKDWYDQKLISAQNGNIKDQNYIGLCYQNGIGFPKNPEKAAQWFKKSSDRNYSYAQNNLAYCYQEGFGVEVNKKKALLLFEKAAEQGLKDAQFHLGKAYFTGTGVDKNPATAIKWFLMSANQGLSESWHNLGVCNEQGIGTSKDIRQARHCFEKAADLGLAESQYVLGLYFKEGIYIEKDLNLAFIWFRKAAEKGWSPAKYETGICYLLGEGVEKNEKEGISFIYSAATDGYAQAQLMVGKIIKNDPKQAVEYLKKAAEQRMPEAQYELGIIYLEGIGVPRHESMAIEYLEKSAAQGFADAQNRLGIYYKESNSKNNLIDAVEWFRRAAVQNHIAAQKNLAKCYAEGIGVEQVPQLATYWYQKAAGQGDKEAKSKLIK